jgi:UDP-N-acetylglucosamine diphosphorylase/glucosamine-1-phosphate N-acetyltransferase
MGMPKDDKEKCSVIILAAGKGTRMKSDRAKVLHAICGRPMLAYVVDMARAAGVEHIAVIIGHQSDVVRETFQAQGLIFVEQTEQLGTGHAVLQAKDVFADYEGTIIILCGDVPLLPVSALMDLVESHISEEAVVTVLTTIAGDPTGYGRVIKRENGVIEKIVEEKDATRDEKKIREINTGIYCVNSRFLFKAVEEINNNNRQKEYYLTDIIEIACKRGHKVTSMIASNPIEVMGINTPEDLQRASEFVLHRANFLKSHREKRIIRGNRKSF